MTLRQLPQLLKSARPFGCDDERNKSDRVGSAVEDITTQKKKVQKAANKRQLKVGFRVDGIEEAKPLTTRDPWHTHTTFSKSKRHSHRS